jgi:hypothetical protein
MTANAQVIARIDTLLQEILGEGQALALPSCSRIDLHEVSMFLSIIFKR